MVQIAGHYDQNAEPSSGDFDPIPVDEYVAVIEQAEVADISSQHDYGRCLVLTWKVQSGPFDGRLIWQRLNLWAQNFAAGVDRKTGHQMSSEEKTKQSVDISNSQFAAVREATGKMNVVDTDELLQIPCKIKVGIKPANGQYKAQNEVKAVKPANASPASRGAPPASRGPAPTQQRGPAPGGAKPAGNASPFAHLKSGAANREMVDDDIPF